MGREPSAKASRRSNRGSARRQQDALRNVSNRAACWNSDPTEIAAPALQCRDRTLVLSVQLFARTGGISAALIDAATCCASRARRRCAARGRSARGGSAHGGCATRSGGPAASCTASQAARTCATACVGCKGEAARCRQRRRQHQCSDLHDSLRGLLDEARSGVR